MSPLDLVRLSDLMKRSQGRPEIMVALIDGPVALDHPDLAGATIREIPGNVKGTCTRAETMPRTHGTLVAGILRARRGSVAPRFVLEAPRCCGPFLRKRTAATGRRLLDGGRRICGGNHPLLGPRLGVETAGDI